MGGWVGVGVHVGEGVSKRVCNIYDAYGGA